MANINPPAKPFTKGNQQFIIGNPAGKPKLFDTPDELWEAACSYFDHCADNPIPYQVVRYRKVITEYQVQAMSLKGLYMHVGVQSLDYYKKRSAFADVFKRIKQVIYVYNFTGAAAGHLKGRAIGWTLRQSL